MGDNEREQRNKRREERVQPFVSPCKIIHGPRKFSAYITELSPDGARISCDSALPSPGTPIVIEVRFGAAAVRSRLPAEVKWVRYQEDPVCCLFGVSFEGIGKDDKRVLDSVLEEFRRRAAAL